MCDVDLQQEHHHHLPILNAIQYGGDSHSVTGDNMHSVLYCIYMGVCLIIGDVIMLY